jgi:hypothetical protein
MLTRCFAFTAALFLISSLATAQYPGRRAQWVSPDAKRRDTSVIPAVAENDVSTPGASGSGLSTRVSRGRGVLPNDQGQIWREYDISPYTMRVSNSEKPQQAIVDWILRETGYASWHGEEAALLSATPRSLRVYHTPDMQQTVSQIVDRFVNSQAEAHSYSVQICTVGHPDWRAKAQRVLRPVPVQTLGAEAWLLAKEDAASLMATLSKRADFRMHGSPRMIVHNGQTATVTLGRTRSFARSTLAPGNQQRGMQPNVGQVTEGFTLGLNPLLSLDGHTVDAMLKCSITQVEKLVPVRLEVPGTLQQGRQWYSIEVPQMVGHRFQEQFRWPRDKVLLVSLGMVPRPVAQLQTPLKLPLSSTSPRGDALVFVESRGASLAESRGGLIKKAERFHGRY